MTRIAVSVVLVMLLSGWTPPSDNLLRFVESKEAAEQATDVDQQAEREMYIGRVIADQQAESEMDIGRIEVKKGNRIGALNRFKIVVTRYQASRHVEEAWVRLTEIYLALGIPSEAQTAVAVLDRKFPNSRWSAEAHDALKAAGLEPAENENSWMSRAAK
jgi:outer membrane protein assembly factor BamD